ncbi:PRC-barrel domain-containing protein [Candidatus Methanomassiliicoccus intestinalis]|uniref:PRC-barrel domain-containing protein n=1 Tax=Candidatus Methanomassiliicoccus intestinalis TaxID=1406512 RepID=UPI0037DCAA94
MSKSETLVETRPLEIGEVEEKNVVSADGRILGKLTGMWINTSTWDVEHLIVEVEKDVAEMLDLKKKMLKGTKTALPVRYVEVVSDVVKLNSTIEELSGSLSESKV